MFKNAIGFIGLTLNKKPNKKEISEIIKKMELETIPFFIMVDNKYMTIISSDEEITA